MESVEVNMLTCTLIFLIKIVRKFTSSTICGKLKCFGMKVTPFNAHMFVFQTELYHTHLSAQSLETDIFPDQLKITVVFDKVKKMSVSFGHPQ